MPTRVIMPRFTDTMKEGVIVKWLKKEGEAVEKGNVVAEVETDKAIVGLEVYEDGILRKILVPEGMPAPVGALIAIIAAPDEDISAFLKEGMVSGKQLEVLPSPGTSTLSKEVEARTEEGEVIPSLASVVREEIEVRVPMASPAAKALAREKGIDLGLVKGTGPGGRISRRDVEEFQPAVPPLERPGEYEAVPFTLMRKVIARKMVESKATIPHFYVTVEIRMEKALELTERLTEAEPGFQVSTNDIILKGVAKALVKYPQVNATFAGEDYRINKEVNVGMVVAVEGGLVTPVLRDCDKKSLGEIARAAQDLVARAKERKVKPEEYTGSTFTVSNMGMFGVDNFSAIINPPESAILAVGAILPKPVIEREGMAIGKVMKVTMSCDHRIIDGLLAAQFLSELKKLLENPWPILL